MIMQKNGNNNCNFIYNGKAIHPVIYKKAKK